MISLPYGIMFHHFYEEGVATGQGAIHDWLPDHPDFEIDQQMTRMMVTSNPDGCLRRKKDG
jgi:cephalosporin hydroxylase